MDDAFFTNSLFCYHLGCWLHSPIIPFFFKEQTVPTWEGTALDLPTHAHGIRVECARSSEVFKSALCCALCKGGRSLAIQTLGCEVSSGAVGPLSSSTCTHGQHIDPFLQHAVIKNLLCAHIVLYNKDFKPYFIPKVNVLSAAIAYGEIIFFITTLGRQAIFRTSLFSSRVLAPIQFVVSKCLLAEQIHLEIEIQSYQHANN